MKNYALRSLNNHRQARFRHEYTIKGFFAIAGIVFLVIGSSRVQAQSNPSGSINNTAPNLGNISPGQFNNIKPVRQPSFPVDAGGSQQFFQGGQERIYFLPEKKSKPILTIDETVEAEGIRYEDLQQKSDDE